MATINKTFGVADPQYDALRVQSNQAIWPDAGGAPVGGAGGLENKIYVWHADGSTVDLFATDATGLGLALAAAATGDTVWIPAVTIVLAAAVTISSSVEVIGIGRERTIISGPVIMSASSALSHLSVVYNANTAGTISAVTGPSSGTSNLYDCNVQGNNANGTGYALTSVDNGTIVHRFCVFSAQSGGADSNPFSSGGATHTELVEISTGAITVTASAGVTISGLTIGQDYAVEAFNGPWNRGPGYLNEYTYRVSNDGGTTWLPSPGGVYLGRDFNGDMHLDLPAWAASAEVVNTNYARIYFTATTTSIKIRVGEDGYWPDNTGTLSWRLWGNAEVGGSIIEGYASDIASASGLTAEIPRYGDRSAYDALNYSTRHANDIGADAGIHHTLAELDLRYTSSTGGDSIEQQNSIPPIGTNLTKYGVVLDVGAGGAWDDDLVESPAIWFDHTQKKYGMVYTGFDGTTEKIGLAWSDDLLTWTKSGSNPILSPTGVGGDPDAGGVTGPLIWFENGTYHLFYIGLTGSGYEIGTASLCHATSTDLTTWTRLGAIISPAGSGWRSTSVFHPSIVKVAATYYLFFNASQSGVERIGYATSADLNTWTVDDGNSPLLSPGSGWEAGGPFGDPSLYLIGDRWYMAYYGTNAGVTAAYDGLAFTTREDFPLGWTRFYNNPVLSPSASYDAKYAHKPFIVNTPGRYYHFYTAVSAGDHRCIALAYEFKVTSGTVTSIATGTGLTGGPITSSGTISDANTGVAAATYGDDSNIPQIAVNAQGRITSASNIAISVFTPINVYNETQTADGTSLTYYLINFAAPGTIRAYIDGIRQPDSDDDDPTDVVTFSSAPALGALLLFDYELDISP